MLHLKIMLNYKQTEISKPEEQLGIFSGWIYFWTGYISESYKFRIAA